MLTFVARRLLLSLPVLAGASVVLFGVLFLLPGDPAAFILGSNARPEDIEALRRSLGLDAPWYVQYVQWLGRLASGDFGSSFVNNFKVVELIGRRLPVTLQLALGAMLVSAVIGIPAGIVSGLYPRGALGRVVDFFNANAVAMPVFWLGLLLQVVVALNLGWLPALGYVEWDENPLDCLRSLIMPSITLGIGSAAIVARFLAAGIVEALEREFILTARAKGLAFGTIIRRHVIPNALIPTVTAMGLQFGRLVGGAVLTEAVFNLPGLGNLLWRSMIQRDYFVIQSLTLLTVVSFIFINLITDLIYGLLDPRIRSAGVE